MKHAMEATKAKRREDPHLHIRGAVRSQKRGWAVTSLVEALLGGSIPLRVSKVQFEDEILKVWLECPPTRHRGKSASKKAFVEQAFLLCQSMMDSSKQECLWRFSTRGLLGFAPISKVFESYWLRALCKAVRERGEEFTNRIHINSAEHIPDWALAMILSMVTGLPIRYIGWENIPLGQRQTDRATAGRQFFNELIDRQTASDALDTISAEAVERVARLVETMIRETEVLQDTVTLDSNVLKPWFDSMRDKQYMVLVSLGKVLLSDRNLMNLVCDKFDASGALVSGARFLLAWLRGRAGDEMVGRIYRRIRTVINLFLIRREIHIFESWRTDPSNGGKLQAEDISKLGTNGMQLRWYIFIQAYLDAGNLAATYGVLSESARSSKGTEAQPRDVVVYIKSLLALRMQVLSGDGSDIREEGVGRRYRVIGPYRMPVRRNFVDCESDDSVTRSTFPSSSSSSVTSD